MILSHNLSLHTCIVAQYLLHQVCLLVPDDWHHLLVSPACSRQLVYPAGSGTIPLCCRCSTRLKSVTCREAFALLLCAQKPAASMSMPLAARHVAPSLPCSTCIRLSAVLFKSLHACSAAKPHSKETASASCACLQCSCKCPFSIQATEHQERAWPHQPSCQPP